MKNLLIILLFIMTAPLASFGQRMNLLNNLGFQFRKTMKATTFSGIDFDEGISKGNKGMYFEINKQKITRTAVGYRHLSIGLAYSDVGIAIKEGRYARTIMDMSSIELPINLGFHFGTIPIGFNLGGYIGYPIKINNQIYDSNNPSISPYPYNGPYEKPIVTFGLT